jgi:hypothetical protein
MSAAGTPRNTERRVFDKLRFAPPVLEMSDSTGDVFGFATTLARR